MTHSNDLTLAINKAKEICLDLKRPNVCIDLFLDALLISKNHSIRSFLESNNLEVDSLNLISKMILVKKKESKSPSSRVSKEVRECISLAELISEEMGQEDCRPETALLAVFLNKKTPKLIEFLKEEGLDFNALEGKLMKFIKHDSSLPIEFIKTFDDEQVDNEDDGEKSFMPMFEENSILEEFSTNLNIQAQKGDFDNLIDLHGKVEEITTILCKKDKPNAILVGDGGTGKTAILELMAKMIVDGTSPEFLEDKVIYNVDLSSMVAGTEFRGMFEERIKEFISEAKKYDNVILFFDEIHTLVGAGGAGKRNDLEASNILKPALARGEISCIGATTHNEYKSKIKPDAALSRRFEKIIIPEPSKYKMGEVLVSLASFYEDHHDVIFSEDFLLEVIPYCERFLLNKRYPDKLVEVLDYCATRGKIKYGSTPDYIKKAEMELRKISEEFQLKLKEDNPKALQKLNAKFEEINELCDRWENDYDNTLSIVNKSFLEEYFNKKRRLFSRSIKEEELGDSFLEEKRYLLKGILDHAKEDSNIFFFYGPRQIGKTSVCNSITEFARKSEVDVIRFSGIDFNPADLCERVINSDNALVVIDDIHLIDGERNSFLLKIFKDKRFDRSDGESIDFGNVDFVLTSIDSKVSSKMGFGDKVGVSEPKIDKDLKEQIKKTFLLRK